MNNEKNFCFQNIVCLKRITDLASCLHENSQHKKDKESLTCSQFLVNNIKIKKKQKND